MAGWRRCLALLALGVLAAALFSCDDDVADDEATIIPRLGRVELPAGYGVLDVVGSDTTDPFDGYCVGPAETLTSPVCRGPRQSSWQVTPADGPLPPLVPTANLDEALKWARNRYGAGSLFGLHVAERVTVSGQDGVQWRVIFGEDSMRTVILVSLSDEETLVVTSQMPFDSVTIAEQDDFFDTVISTLRITR